MFLNRSRYLLVLGSILPAVGFLFSSERKTETLISQSLLRHQKNLSKIFLQGEYLDYLEFVHDQRASKKLEWKQFLEIHELAKLVSKTLDNAEMKEDVKQGVLILHISRNIGIEEAFQKLKESSFMEKEESIFKAAFFSFLVEVAESSPESFTEEIYLDLKRMKKACFVLKKQGVKEAYSYYKTKLANLLELDMDSVLNRHLLKIALKKRIYSVEEIQKEKKALLELSFDKLQEVIHDEHVVVDLL